jgi:hypothetical protein
VTEPEYPEIAGVARQMALAIYLHEVGDCGDVKNDADLAGLGPVKRALMAQIRNTAVNGI